MRILIIDARQQRVFKRDPPPCGFVEVYAVLREQRERLVVLNGRPQTGLSQSQEMMFRALSSSVKMSNKWISAGTPYLHECLQRVRLCRGDDGLPERLVGRVDADGEGGLEVLEGELGDGVGDA